MIYKNRGPNVQFEVKITPRLKPCLQLASSLYIYIYILLTSYYDSNPKLLWFKIPSEIRSHVIFAFHQQPHGFSFNVCSHMTKLTPVQG